MLYVIRSDLLKKNIYKIGKKEKNSESELRSRYNTYYGDPKIYYFHEFGINYDKMERNIHNMLDDYRLYKNRELFKCKYAIIDYKLSKIDGRYNKKNIFSQKLSTLKYKLAKLI